MRCASPDCVVGTQKKGTEFTLICVAEVRSFKFADDKIKHDSESAMPVVNVWRISIVPRFNHPPHLIPQFPRSRSFNFPFQCL